MPVKNGISVFVTVGGAKLQEFVPEDVAEDAELVLEDEIEDADCYVESELFTGVSYKKIIYEKYAGGVEEVPWPVTPYKVKVINQSGSAACWATVFVDGVKVKRVHLKGGEHKEVDGFEEADGTKEFVFSLPRFAESEKDRVDDSRTSDVGKIKVLVQEATYMRKEIRAGDSRDNLLDFSSANKKDANKCTKGKYTMSTTTTGNTIRARAKAQPYNKQTEHTIWSIGPTKAEFCIKYRMREVLEMMGLKAKKPAKNSMAAKAPA